MSCGGLSDVKQADTKVQHICDSVKAKVEGKTGKKYKTFQAKSYKTQCVNGTNYFVKVHVGGEDYVHIRVYETNSPAMELQMHGSHAVPHAVDVLQVQGVQESKKRSDPIDKI